MPRRTRRTTRRRPLPSGRRPTRCASSARANEPEATLDDLIDGRRKSDEQLDWLEEASRSYAEALGDKEGVASLAPLAALSKQQDAIFAELDPAIARTDAAAVKLGARACGSGHVQRGG